MKKRAAIITILILIAGAVTAWYLFNKPTEMVKDQETVASFTSVELYDYFIENEGTATEKYADKVIEVQGTLVEILQNDDNSTSVILASDDMMFGVKGKLIPSQKTTDLVKGEKIKIKGYCSGMNSDVELNRCIIL